MEEKWRKKSLKPKKASFLFLLILLTTLLMVFPLQVPEVEAQDINVITTRERYNEASSLKYPIVPTQLTEFNLNYTYSTTYGTYVISKVDGTLKFWEHGGVLLVPSAKWIVQYDKDVNNWQDLNQTNIQFQTATINQLVFKVDVMNGTNQLGTLTTTILFSNLNAPKISVTLTKATMFTSRLLWKITVPTLWNYLVEGLNTIDFSSIKISRNVDRVRVANITDIINSKLNIVVDWTDFGVSIVELKGVTISIFFYANTVDPTLLEYYNSGDTSDDTLHGTTWVSQTFTSPGQHDITSVKLKMRRSGLPGILTVGIRATLLGRPDGSDLTSGTINASTFTNAYPGQWYEIDLADYELSANTKYAIVARAPSGNTTNNVVWRYDGSGTYESGSYWGSGDSGDFWFELPDDDLMFEEWGSGYVLNLRTKDWNDNVLTGTTAYSNTTSKNVNSTGWVRFAGYQLNSIVNVKVKWQNSWVNGTFSVTVNSDKTIDVKCKVYDVTLQAKDSNGVNVPRAIIYKITNVNSSITEVTSNSNGYLAFKSANGSIIINTWWGAHLTNASLSMSILQDTTQNINTKIQRLTYSINYLLFSLNNTILTTPTLQGDADWIMQDVTAIGTIPFKLDNANWKRTDEPNSFTVGASQYTKGTGSWGYSNNIFTFNAEFSTKDISMTWFVSEGGGGGGGGGGYVPPPEIPPTPELPELPPTVQLPFIAPQPIANIGIISIIIFVAVTIFYGELSKSRDVRGAWRRGVRQFKNVQFPKRVSLNFKWQPLERKQINWNVGGKYQTQNWKKRNSYED